MSTVETVALNPAGMMMKAAHATTPLTENNVEENPIGVKQHSVESNESHSVRVTASVEEQTRQRRMSLLALALCTGALWGLAFQGAQIAQLNQGVSLLKSRVTAAQSANESLYNEMYQLTSVPHILSLAKRSDMKFAGTAQVSLNS